MIVAWATKWGKADGSEIHFAGRGSKIPTHTACEE